METTLRITVERASTLVGVDSGGTCDPYFIMTTPPFGNSPFPAFKSKKMKKQISPVYAQPFTFYDVTRKQIANGDFVGKPIIIDFFDWNQFQKHTFLGRAEFEIGPDMFANSDSVEKKFHLRELREGEPCLVNPKVKKEKSGSISNPKDHAKGSSKANLQSYGLGEVTIFFVLDDMNIDDVHLNKIKENVKMSSEKISKMYADYVKAGKSKDYNINSVEKFIVMLKETKLFEALMLKWNGNDPTTNKHWDLFSKDEPFMNLLCKGLFVAFDIDGDGHITFDEFCTSVYYILEGNQDDALRMRFRSIDVDHSGFIDMKEAVIMGEKTCSIIRVSFMVGLHQQKYQLMKCGLSEDDFMPLLDAMEKAFTQNKYAEKEAKLLFKYADKDEDGQISEHEYITFMKDSLAQGQRQKELDLIMAPVKADLTVNVQAAMMKILAKVAK